MTFEQHPDPIALSLDALAEADRRAAGDDFEDRVFDATHAALRRRLQHPATRSADRVPGLRRRTVWLTPMRMAALFALCATAIVAYMGANLRPATTTGQTVTASLESDIDAWFTALDTFDVGVEDDIDALSRETASLSDTLDEDWLEWLPEETL